MPKDEAYVLALCDQVLGTVGLRQHRFDFLRGDPGEHGRCAMLPCDAYYPDYRLVIEYRERQHSEPVAFMDRRIVIGGITRGEQRKRYDERRRAVFGEQQISLVELDYRKFEYGSRKRLIRTAADVDVVIKALELYRPDRRA